MLTGLDLPNALGAVAGALILLSGWPALREQLRRARAGTPGERLSRLMMAAGNALWVVVGLLMGNYALSVMTGLNALIQCAIWLRMRLPKSTDGEGGRRDV